MPIQPSVWTFVLSQSVWEQLEGHWKFHCSGLSRSPMPLSRCIMNSMSAFQTALLSCAFSYLQFQPSQCSVSEMSLAALSASRSAGLQLILRIWQTLDTSVRSTGWSFGDIPGGRGDLSDNLNVASPFCQNYDQNALTISSVSEIYHTAVIYLFWARYYCCVVHRFWLPCQISNKFWTLAILCNYLSSASLFISKSFSVFIVSNAVSSPTNIPVLIWAHCLSMSFLWCVWPLVCNCLQPIRSYLRETLAYTLIRCIMIENILHARLERSLHVECVSSCWHHQSGIVGSVSVLWILICSKQQSITFGLSCPQFIGDPAAEFEHSVTAFMKCAVQWCCPDIVSATLFSIWYSSSSLATTYALEGDCPALETLAKVKWLLLGTVSGCMMSKQLCLKQDSFSTYFSNANWY